MKHILAPFIWIDSLLQRGVDAAAFFLMRRMGFRKALIVYATSIIFYLSLASLILLNRDRIPSWILVVTGLIFFLALLGVHAFYIESIADEEKGYILSRDDYKQLETASFLKLMFFSGVPITIAQPSIIPYFGGAYLLFAQLTGLVRVYLAKTPNTPPAQKKTVLEPASNTA